MNLLRLTDWPVLSLQGLTEWQLNSYYAAGRVMVPALLDIFTCQGFFKRQALLDLLTELAGSCSWVVSAECRPACPRSFCSCPAPLPLSVFMAKRCQEVFYNGGN